MKLMPSIKLGNDVKLHDLSLEKNAYDVVVDIDSIIDGVRGWYIWDYTNDKRFVRQKEDLTKGIYSIALVGDFGVGKSMIQSFISGTEDLPSDDVIHTRGISMKRVKMGEKGWHEVIDFVGFQTPLRKDEVAYKEKSLKGTRRNPYHDLMISKKRDEEFLYQVALSMAQLFIVVVNELTLQQQFMIEEIKATVRKRGKGNMLYVIHNWKSIQNKKNYEHLVQTQCAEIFEGRLNEIDGVYIYYETKLGRNEFDSTSITTEGDSDGVMHFFLASQNCEFGKKLNALVFKRIRRLLTLKVPRKNSGFISRLQNAGVDKLLKEWVRSVDRENPSVILTKEDISYESWAKFPSSNSIKEKKYHEKIVYIAKKNNVEDSKPVEINLIRKKEMKTKKKKKKKKKAAKKKKRKKKRKNLSSEEESSDESGEETSGEEDENSNEDEDDLLPEGYREIFPDGVLKIKFEEKKKKSKSVKKKERNNEDIIGVEKQKIEFQYFPASRFSGLSDGISGNFTVGIDCFITKRRFRREKNESLCFVIIADIPGYKQKKNREKKFSTKKFFKGLKKKKEGGKKFPEQLEDEVKVEIVRHHNERNHVVEFVFSRTSILNKRGNNKGDNFRILRKERGTGAVTKNVEVPLSFDFERAEKFADNGILALVFKKAVIKSGKNWLSSDEDEGETEGDIEDVSYPTPSVPDYQEKNEQKKSEKDKEI